VFFEPFRSYFPRWSRASKYRNCAAVISIEDPMVNPRDSRLKTNFFTLTYTEIEEVFLEKKQIMDTNPNNNQAPAPGESSGIAHRLLLASIVVGAIGAGVTGTLLWMDNQPQSPVQSPSSPATSSPQMPMPVGAAPVSANGISTMPGSTPQTDSDSQHQPPASLTAGMPPVQVALTLGNWYFDHEAWSNAVAQYRKVLDMGMDNPDIRTDYGSALRFNGQPREALEQYRLAQKKDPRHENSLFNQGGLYASDFKDPAKAIAAWQQYIKRFPTGKSVAQAKSLIEREQGKLKVG